MQRPLALTGLLVCSVVSACVAQGDAAGMRPLDVVADAETGAIAGSVVTLELQPVVGASVAIILLNVTQLTDEVGRFVLPFLPPGSHRVLVSFPGYGSQERDVEVVAGQTTPEVVLTLVEVGRIVPYHTTTIHKVLVSGYSFTVPRDCIYVTPQVKSCQGSLSDCNPDECEIHYGHCGDGGPYQTWGCDFGLGWKTIIAELTSQPSSAVTGHGWSFTVLGPNVSRASGDAGAADNGEKRAWRTVAQSPIYTWIDQAELERRLVEEKDWCGGINIAPGRCDWVWRVFPGPCEIQSCEFPAGNVGIMQEQAATIYFSYFMHEAAPTGWTARPDA
jgi:hypothetical protein